jgi:tRNA pseudouridine32 synthase/23S rRNA pseudouridine746 synthase
MDKTLASIPVIFENEDVIILNKPGNLLSIQDGYDPSLPNLRGMLQDEYEKIWAVHRLDKETSGIILFAKNAETHRFLNQQFSDRLVKKIYWAIVQGFPVWAEKMIDFPLKVNGDRKHRTTIDQKSGKEALTFMKVISKENSWSKFEITPSTGYTHQIRAHCSAIGLPIIGDHLYFRGCMLDEKSQNENLLLHAYSLLISINTDERPRLFIAQPPQYFESFSTQK